MSENAPTLNIDTLDVLFRSNARDQAMARKGRITAQVLVSAFGLVLLGLIFSSGLPAPVETGLNLRTLLLVDAGALVVLFILNRQGLVLWAGLGLALVLLGAGLWLLDTTGPATANAVALAIPVVAAGLFSSPSAAIFVAVLAMGGFAMLNAQVDPFYWQDLTSGETSLLVYINLIVVATISWLFSWLAQGSLRETATLTQSISSQREQLEEQITSQTRQLQATTTVARAISGTRNLDVLLENIVRLVRETFGYYHVQVFLNDENNEFAVLRQSTGDVGQVLLERGHKLAVGSLSVIGQVTSSGRPVIASDTQADFVHRRNELLPHTRAELAIPLTVGNRVIGALDMQSIEPNAFEQEMLPTFQALADQLSVAIENARLFERAQQNLSEFRELNRDVTQRTWSDFLAETRDIEQKQTYGPEPRSLEIHRSRVVERVTSSKSIVASTGKDGRQAFIAAPVMIRNEVIGVLGVEPDSAREWTQEDLQLLERISERVALAIENARLYLQAQRSAERERLIGDIATKLQRAPSLALLLKSATQELSSALGTDHVYAEINLDQTAQADGPPTGANARSVDSEPVNPAEATPNEQEEARAEQP